MKELIEKHKEAIEAHTVDGAAFKCAMISHDYGEIQRLEGMIEVYKYVIYNRPEPYDIRPQYKALQAQLKELKGE